MCRAVDRAVSKGVDWQDGGLAEVGSQWVDRADVDNAVGKAVDKEVDKVVVWRGGCCGG